MLKKLLKTLVQNNTPLSIGLIILGTIIWSTTMVKGGLVYASGESFASVVIPVRGKDFWEESVSPAEVAILQKELIDKYEFKSTFLLRPDIFLDDSTFASFKNNFDKHELGIYFEITPALANASEVAYPKGEKADANRFFLSGYSTDKREKFIDTAFSKFKDEYGFFPTSVGAWHIDSYSAKYMRQKYGVTSIMLVADQFSMDRYRVWGAWWGVPYYPSKNHILVPAQSLNNKLDVVITQWAVRDPVNGYGGGNASLFSVQPNDYTNPELGLTTSYFSKLLDVYLVGRETFGHVTIGIENELYLSNKPEFENQLKELSRRQNEGIKVVTMNDFSDWYRNNFKGTSPESEITAKDPLGMDKSVTWMMTKDYRMGLRKDGEKTYLIDLRTYKKNSYEPFLLSTNLRSDLRVETEAVLDSVKNPGEIANVDGMSHEEILAKFLPGKDIKFDLKHIWRLLIVMGAFAILIRMKNKIGIEKKALLLILLGTIFWSTTMVKSGLTYPYGMGFWGPNGHDGVWHIAVIESLSRGSWEIPVFAGETLKNYHIGYDLLLAWLHKLTFIPVSTLYFQIIPPLLAISIGIFAYKFVYTWRRSKIQAFWATFFVYFGGSFGWLVTLLRSGEQCYQPTFWSQQSVSTLINPPFALSILLIFLGLDLLIKGVRNKNKKLLTVATFIFGILIQIKVYAGILALGSLFVAGFWRMLKRDGIDLLKVFTGSLIISLLLFLPVTKSVSSVVIFKPFWFLETMMGFSDRFYWPKFAEAMVNYKLAGNFIKGVAAYTVAFIIFIIGNFGLRLIKDIWIYKKLKDFRNLYFMDVFIFSVIGAGIIIPMFYVQRGTAWNTIQFMYYSLMFSGVLAGIFIGEVLEKKINVKKNSMIYHTKMIFIVLLILLLTIPTTIGTLKHYLPARPPARISNEEIEALRYLQKRPYGIVLTYPFDKFKAEEAKENPPRPLYLYESTAYVPAFSKKPVYLEDEVNLEITGYNWRERRAEVENFYTSYDVDFVRRFLLQNNISYIYWIRGQRATLGEGQLGLTQIFANQEVEIYEVN